MAGSVHSDAYRAFCRALVDARKGAGLSQAQLARRLGKPASFVGKYEVGERRLDVIEVMVILDILETKFEAFWDGAEILLPENLR